MRMMKMKMKITKKRRKIMKCQENLTFKSNISRIKKKRTCFLLKKKLFGLDQIKEKILIKQENLLFWKKAHFKEIVK